MKIERSNTDYELSFCKNSGTVIDVVILESALTQQNEELLSYYLTFQIHPETYQYIDTEALFNLKPEIRSPFSNGAFRSATNITIKATLDPALLPQLATNSTTLEQVVTYIQHLSQEKPNHPLFSTHSWYATEVTQKTESGETG